MAVIDRRHSHESESANNRKKFLERHKKQLKRAVRDSVVDLDMSDILGKDGIEVTIEGDMDQYTFSHRRDSGSRDIVLPGNKEYEQGDKILKPEQGGGRGADRRASNGDDDVDEFKFRLTSDEFMELFFDDLALPDIVKKQLNKEKTVEYKNAGFAKDGGPQALNVIRTFKNAFGRKLALDASIRAQIEEAKEKGDKALVEELEARRKRIPFLDDVDVRYDYKTAVPTFKFSAVMFCLMDVSGSMMEIEKDMAKRFFILLYMFLKRNYTNLDVVFVRHTTTAEEVDEQEFFYGRKSGGTCISAGLAEVSRIIDERYDLSKWNVYLAQASDGDNWEDDDRTLKQMIEEKILPAIQYYSYIELKPSESSFNAKKAASKLYHQLTDYGTQTKKVATAIIREYAEIWPVFKDLFKKREKGDE